MTTAWTAAAQEPKAARGGDAAKIARVMSGSGPHVMIITPDTALLDSLPTDPNNGGPWVMWKGTKYAHVMVPTAPMPKQAAKKTPAKPASK